MSADACTPNIGPAGIRRRMLGGLATLGLAMVAALLLLAIEAPRWWRLVLLLPFWSAGLGIFQAREKT